MESCKRYFVIKRDGFGKGLVNTKPIINPNESDSLGLSDRKIISRTKTKNNNLETECLFREVRFIGNCYPNAKTKHKQGRLLIEYPLDINIFTTEFSI